MSINQIVTNMGISWWDLIEKALAAVGVVGIVVSIFRLIFTLKRVTWVSNVSIEDYPLDYDEESTEKNPESITLMDEECVQCGCGNTVVFKPVECIIPQLKIIELNSKGRKKRVYKTYKNVTPETPKCFRIIRTLSIPRYKLRWYCEYGEYGEHFFSMNGRNGNNSVGGCIYHKTIWSIIRRILDLK